MTLIDNTQQVDVSEQRRLPVDNVGTDKAVAITGETVQMYFYHATTKVYTIDAGEAAGVGVVAKLAYRNVKNAAGDVTGTYKDSSLSFTSTALIKEKPFPYIEVCKFDADTGASKLAAAITGFNNGEYCVDYRTGMIYGKKASVQVTLTSTAYKVESGTSSSAGPSSDVTIVDSSGNDAVVTDDSAQAATPPFVNVGGEYRAAPTGYTDGDATILQTNINGGLRISGGLEHDVAIGSTNDVILQGVEAADFDGAALPNDVAEGDAVRPKGSLYGVQYVMLVNEDGSSQPAYDSGTDSDKGFEINPLSDHHEESTLAAVTNGTDATYSYYVDMDGYRNFALQTTLSGGSGTATMTVEATLQDDGTAAASCAYVDVTTALFGAASYTASGYHAVDTPVPIKYLKVKIVASTGGANDADWTLYFKKQY